MKPLIDADILLHELGWSGQFKDKETGEEVLLGVEHVIELLDEKISDICWQVGATTPPILFLTNSEWLTARINKDQRYTDNEVCRYIPNFRYEVATTKPYKGTRNNPKPYHFYNITAYLLSNYEVVVSRGGVEADDMMCLHQTSHENTIICSRDKDLRICPGWHYSWECGGQRAIGPVQTDRLGSIELVKKSGVNTIVGYGLKFFFSQMITGDAADNIPGLPKQGAVKAYKLLEGCTTEEEMFKAVQGLYKEVMGEGAKEYFQEMKSLLWMKQTGMWEYKYVS